MNFLFSGFSAIVLRMEIMKISKISYEPKISKSVQPKTVNNPVLKERQINPNIIFNNYTGRDLVSFKAEKTFAQTVKDNYFKLPNGFQPDFFQVEAAKGLYEGKDVLVEAPTGTGKTAIAHYAVSNNMEKGKTTFYTTPLKALSNQKLNEFRAVYGDENVGILTGDRRENVNAPVIIMTTEVYRNMALSNMYGSENPIMKNLGTVIFDEFHYLGDPERGPVWEESLMYTPKGVQTLELSATIGNPDELTGWINSLNGNNTALVSVPPEQRHVPLKFDMLETAAYRAEDKRMSKQLERRGYIPDSEVSTLKKPVLSDFKFAVNTLKQRDELPAIFFVFSRKYSRELLEYLSNEGHSLTTQNEKQEIQNIIKKYKSQNYIGSDLNEEALKNGYAIHNAGIIPAQKELIEELFQKKLLKVVIATETLAAGINMPARTVVISSAYKPTDEASEEEENSNARMLTSNEYKQMAGRAGRRGIDKIGYVYTMPIDKKMEQDFIMLEAIPSNSIESKYNPDYAFLSGYYEHNDNKSGLKDIFSKTFYTYSPDETQREEAFNALDEISSKRTNVLVQRGFINKENDKYSLTPKGYMASKVRGYDTLTLVETIANKTFDGITPEALAAIAGVMANPARTKAGAIGTDTDLHEIVTSLESNLQRIYDKLNTSINSKLKKLDVNAEDFSSFAEMLEFAKSIQQPDKDEKTLQEEFKQQEERRTKMYVITSQSGNYSLESLVSALKNGETVPTKVLENFAETVEQFKSRMNTKDIQSYIEKLQANYRAQDSSSKGAKAKARIEREKKEISEKINRAKLMKKLDEIIPDALASNYEFLKNNPPAQVKKDYHLAELALTKSSSKDTLISEIKAVMSIEDYIDNHSLSEEGMTNLGRIGNSIKSIINTALDVNKTETENGITKKPDVYGKRELQAVYMWAALNKMNEGSINNWYELLRNMPMKEVDEGGIYRIIMQTADLLSQIGEIAEAGAKSTENRDDIEYYMQLRKTAAQARELLIREPASI